MLISNPERTKTRFAYPSLPSGSSLDWKRLTPSSKNIEIIWPQAD
jgi:hypothetical protein